jgi:hypothetical protein
VDSIQASHIAPFNLEQIGFWIAKFVRISQHYDCFGNILFDFGNLKAAYAKYSFLVGHFIANMELKCFYELHIIVLHIKGLFCKCCKLMRVDTSPNLSYNYQSDVKIKL